MKDHRFKKYFKYVALNVLIAAVVSVLLINYVASAYKIKGHSMRSVLKDQERVIISKLGIRNGNIKRFDIVVLNKPNEHGKSVVKRVIGLPGEIIEIKEGDVYINYKKLEQPFLSEKENHSYQGDNMRPLLIQEGHYFVLGDNRAISQDSRSFGTVPEKYIYGKTIFRYWPLSRFGKIE